jgi:hypothetical protein
MRMPISQMPLHTRQRCLAVAGSQLMVMQRKDLLILTVGRPTSGPFDIVARRLEGVP